MLRCVHVADTLSWLTLARYILEPLINFDVRLRALLIFLAAVPADFLPCL